MCGTMPAMLRRWLIIGSLCLSLVGTATQAQDVAGDLLGRINNLRASLGLPGYRINGALSAAAQAHAQWMADNASITHNRPDGSGPRTRAINAGYGTTDVSENIYGGTNANVNSAWTFWINSSIHYRGLTNTRYQEVGIGAARSGWGATYVLVFGNPGGPPPFVPQAAAGASGSISGFVEPPSYVIGVDPRGFIMHEIQPEDTLGDIALIYGYTWDDIPYMMEINELADNRSLQIGEVFLVPPYDGTFTPTPGNADADELVEAEITPIETGPPPTATQQPTLTPSPRPTRMLVATAAAMPEVLALAVEPSPTPQTVALIPTPMRSSITTDDRPSTTLIIALVLQVGLLVIAGAEFVRRTRRRS